jgi:hypothetical protein
VFVDARIARGLPHVRIVSRHCTRYDGPWIELQIPMSELNPDGLPFDRIVLRAALPAATVEFDAIGLTRAATGR